MTLVDTSAWIEFLRGTGSAADQRLAELLADPDTALHSTDAVYLELLAGARNAAEERRLRAMLDSCSFLPTEGRADFEAGAALYRRCRARGVTVRSPLDCLIAVVAIRNDVPVLHADRDFTALAAHTALRVH